MNDMVALLRPHNMAAKLGLKTNVGDFRTAQGSGPVAIAPHDTTLIIKTLNFLKSIRNDLGMPKEFPEGFLEESARIAAEAFPDKG